MKKLMLLSLVFLGCSTAQVVTCPLESQFNNSFSSGFATTFNCTNQAAIIADMQTLETGLNLCPASSSPGKVKGIYGDLCTAVADAFISNYLAAKIPAKYGCSPTAVVATATTWVNNECQMLGRVRKSSKHSSLTADNEELFAMATFEKPTPKNTPKAAHPTKKIQTDKKAPTPKEIY
jgi:hypothetical protein